MSIVFSFKEKLLKICGLIVKFIKFLCNNIKFLSGELKYGSCSHQNPIHGTGLSLIHLCLMYNSSVFLLFFPIGILKVKKIHMTQRGPPYNGRLHARLQRSCLVMDIMYYYNKTKSIGY